METYGAMQAQIDNWLREPSGDLGLDAINDSVESLWESLITMQLSMFLEGPVAVSFANASERVTLVSIADPLIAPTAVNFVLGALGARTYSIAYTLVTESGSETLLSPILSFNALLSNLAEVASPAFAEGAMGWNCYAGLTGARMCKQNDEPILFGTTFLEPEDGFVDEPERPSPPTENTTADDIWYIRQLELQTTDGAYRAWNQADLDSSLMRAAGNALPSTSQYQNHYWDLINGRRLEMRPAAGSALAPRYFYIRKPRRSRFASAPLPFLQQPSQAFIRYNSLSLLSLSVHEYSAADRWEKKAEAERLRCLQAVTQQNHGKNRRVVPFMG